MTTIRFDRIGRHHDLTLTTDTLLEDPAIVDDIERFASRYLLASGSPDILVYEDGRVTLDGGRAGVGSVVGGGIPE